MAAWKSPSVRLSSCQPLQVDVYAFAILLYECITGDQAWADLDHPMQVSRGSSSGYASWRAGIMNWHSSARGRQANPKGWEKLAALFIPWLRSG